MFFFPPPPLTFATKDRGLVGGLWRGVGRTLDASFENAAHRREVYRGVGRQTFGQHFELTRKRSGMVLLAFLPGDLNE